MNVGPTLKLGLKLGLSASALIAAAGVIAPASAEDIVQTYNFYRITNLEAFVGNQLTVEVRAEALSSPYADFTFRNNVGIRSVVTGIYFDDGSLFGINQITQGGGPVNTPAFRSAPGNSTLPAGQNANPDFVSSQLFDLDLERQPTRRGLNEAADWVTVRFNLINGQQFHNVLTALSLPTAHTWPEGPGGTPTTPDNWLRIGLHVQSIGGGSSDSYINNSEYNRVTVVPLPPAAYAGLGSLACVAFLAIRRRRNLATA